MSQLPPPVRTAQPKPAANDDAAIVFRTPSKKGRGARISIQGVAGSGKTWTSLCIAHGLSEGEKFAVVDTEHESASLYLGINGIQFASCPMNRYDPRDLIKALDQAASQGFGVVVIDSLSHFWKGIDGTLAQVEKAASRFGGNSFAGWKDGTPLQNDMVDALLSYPGHVIATMRSVTEWVLQENARGRREPVMVGMRPEQRKGIEYEFDLVAEMDVTNRLRFLKSRCPALHQQILERPDGARDIAKPVLDWLRSTPQQSAAGPA
ncbi:ATP-binding protein [Streptomyces lateritius]|uniref:ATP-binding protein n=1 Tax=Streptomyces lateritius TaxID=67313 RepID=UPI001C8B799F|nr:ATP-binding protein [Streptomyces lateritius]MBX9425482.1 ATP-binding protein [Streptomyces lateritius]